MGEKKTKQRQKEKNETHRIAQQLYIYIKTKRKKQKKVVDISNEQKRKANNSENGHIGRVNGILFMTQHTKAWTVYSNFAN